MKGKVNVFEVSYALAMLETIVLNVVHMISRNYVVIVIMLISIYVCACMYVCQCLIGLLMSPKNG